MATSDWPANAAEERKRNGPNKYESMYDKIGYGFRGFAVEVGGRLGPEAESLIRWAQGAWLRRGELDPPEGSDWTCPTFATYWRRRIIGSVQRASALMAVDQARRVAEQRLLWAHGP